MAEYYYRHTTGVGVLISFGAIMEILGASELDQPLRVSLYCFAFALPINGIIWLEIRDYKRIKSMDSSRKNRTISSVISVVQFVPIAFGLLSVLFHYSPNHAAVFFLSAMLAMTISANWEKIFGPDQDRQK